MDVAAAGASPLLHYTQFGMAESRAIAPADTGLWL